MTIEIGSKVAYSVQFLKSIGESHSDMARGRGIVTALENHGADLILAVVAWNGKQPLPERVLIHNLARVGPNTKFCEC